MNEAVISWMAFACPALFGIAMGLIAYWIFNLSAAKHAPEAFGKTVAWVVSWMVGNGATLVGGVLIVSPTEALQGLPRGALLMALGYLAGFGLGIIIAYGTSPATDKSIVGELSRYLNGKQLETILLLYRYGVKDIQEAAKQMGLAPDEFKELHLEALKILQRRANSLLPKVGSK